MTKCASGLVVFACGIGLFVACGGSALDDGGASGASHRAGSSSGGATNGAAGAVSHGGTSAAGAASGGAPAGGAPAGGSAAGGASAIGACALPAESGMCDAYIPSFRHNPTTGLCEPFIYGGCGGNANRFATRAACLAACPDSSEDWGACKADTDCTSVNTDCCGCEPGDEYQLLALQQGRAMSWNNQHCATAGICAPCQQPGETQQVAKYFKPVCVNGQCSILDIRQSKLTACNTSSDCTLRNGAACCAECDQSGWISVNTQADFCSGKQAPCPACASAPPKGLVPICQVGVCQLSGLTR